MAIAIRKLECTDGEMLRRFWLDGLQDFPLFFASPDDLAAFPPGYWQAAIAGPGHQMFGLFDSAQLIGITAAFAQREDPAAETAIFGMSFIAPPWRGRGLSRLLYDARLEWTRARPQFKRGILSHRQSNTASRRAHRRYGFVLTDTVLQTGPDGRAEPEEFYEIAV